MKVDVVLKKFALTLAGSAVLLASLTGCSASASTPAASSTASPMASPSPDSPSAMATPSMSSPGDLGIATGALGEIVVDGKGMTAYVFDNDVPNSGASMCTGACATIWPAITSASASPQAFGITGTLSTIPAADGTKQITVNGMPLYTFSKDLAPMDTKGQGVKNVWHALTSSGVKVSIPAAG